jgi:hypothetical protein
MSKTTDPTKSHPIRLEGRSKERSGRRRRKNEKGAENKMAERFEGILEKKEDACVKGSNVQEKKQAERFNMLMTTTEKKINLEENKTKLEERRVELATALHDMKMLTMRMDELVPMW